MTKRCIVLSQPKLFDTNIVVLRIINRQDSTVDNRPYLASLKKKLTGAGVHCPKISLALMV